MKARLLFTEDCNRKCKGCCNRNWNGEPAKEVSYEELISFDEIYITGGEPMLHVEELKDLVLRLKKSDKKVFLYTALPCPYPDFIRILREIDGCTLTIRSKADYKLFKAFELDQIYMPRKTLRLNVFPKIKFKSDVWDVRPKVWIDNAPLPSGEVFVKLKK
jgi:organic radical activating enzyme